MPNARKFASIALILLVGGALLYVGWNTLDRLAESVCSECGRPVHLASRADGEAADGARLTFCCAACALRAEKQQSRGIRLTRVFDYETGEALPPEQAFAVAGSNVNHCMRDHVLMDHHKETSDLQFDRCAPSVLAFPTQRAAEAFQSRHGGVVTPFPDLEESMHPGAIH